jgi:hypothetical protein
MADSNMVQEDQGAIKPKTYTGSASVFTPDSEQRDYCWLLGRALENAIGKLHNAQGSLAHGRVAEIYVRDGGITAEKTVIVVLEAQPLP